MQQGKKNVYKGICIDLITPIILSINILWPETHCSNKKKLANQRQRRERETERRRRKLDREN